MKKFTSSDTHKDEQAEARKCFEQVIVFIPGARIEAKYEYPLCITLPSKWDSDFGFIVRYDRYKHRFEISGRWPRAVRPDSGQQAFNPWNVGTNRKATEITVSADKTPAQIANDINKRFLPEYAVTFDVCAQARDRDDNYLANRDALAQQVAAACGGSVSGRNGCTNLVEVPAFNAHFEASEKSLSLKASGLPVEAACKLAAFLVQLNAEAAI